MMCFRSIFLSSLLLLAPALALAGGVKAGDRHYEVTITNLTKASPFTPALAVTHDAGLSLFTPGEPVLDELATLAESGATGDLQALLDSLTGLVSNTAIAGGFTAPGGSQTISIDATSPHDVLSLAAMVIPTNDTFVGIRSIALPRSFAPVMLLVPAWDAGSEENDELCASLPGPTCGPMDAPGGPGEGYVYIGNGIQGIGDLDPASFDWNNPVARVIIQRVRRAR